MSTKTATMADGSATLTAEARSVAVKDGNGTLLRMVSRSGADVLVSMGHGEWIGTGNRRHVRMRTDIALIGSGRISGNGTRPVLADGKGKMAKDQRVGNARELLPLYR